MKAKTPPLAGPYSARPRQAEYSAAHGVHDAPILARDHMRPCRLAREERSQHVHGKVALQPFERDLGKGFMLRIPALFTSVSIWPNSASAAAIDALGAVGSADGTVVGDRAAAGLPDLGDYLIGRLARRGAVAGERRAEVVHDDGSSPSRKGQRVLAAKSPPGAGNHHDSVRITQFSHERAFLSESLPRLVRHLAIDVSQTAMNDRHRNVAIDDRAGIRVVRLRRSRRATCDAQRHRLSYSSETVIATFAAWTRRHGCGRPPARSCTGSSERIW